MRGLSGAATCGWVEVSSELLEGADALWRVGSGKPPSKNVTSLALCGDAQVMGQNTSQKMIILYFYYFYYYYCSSSGYMFYIKLLSPLQVEDLVGTHRLLRPVLYQLPGPVGPHQFTPPVITGSLT